MDPPPNCSAGPKVCIIVFYCVRREISTTERTVHYIVFHAEGLCNTSSPDRTGVEWGNSGILLLQIELGQNGEIE